MGEAKRRGARPIDAIVDAACKEFVAKGRLIEAGWIGMRLTVIAKDAPQAQLDEMRMAFFAGAQHLFGSIMGILDPGEEPSHADLSRMDLIDKELREFIEVFKLRNLPADGSA